VENVLGAEHTRLNLPITGICFMSWVIILARQIQEECARILILPHQSLVHFSDLATGDSTIVMGQGVTQFSVPDLWRFGALKEDVEGEMIHLNNTEYSVPLKLQLLSYPIGYRSCAYIGARIDFTGEGQSFNISDSNL